MTSLRASQSRNADLHSIQLRKYLTQIGVELFPLNKPSYDYYYSFSVDGKVSHKRYKFLGGDSNNLNRKELITKVVNRCNERFRIECVNAYMVDTILSIAIETIIEALRQHETISIRGFGSIHLVEYNQSKKAWDPFRRIPMAYIPNPRIKITYSPKIKKLLKGMADE